MLALETFLIFRPLALSLEGYQQVVIRLVEGVGLAVQLRSIKAVERKGIVAFRGYFEKFVVLIDSLDEFVANCAV